MIPFPPCCSQIRLLTFHSFSFLYFKTSNQDYLIPFNFILFHSFHWLKYISFCSILFRSIFFHSILLWSFHSIPLWIPKRSLRVTTYNSDLKTWPYLPNTNPHYSLALYCISWGCLTNGLESNMSQQIST